MQANKVNINKAVSLLTKHGKQDIIAPIFKSSFGTSIIHTDKFDTDSLGSFDHKILRTLSPIECALKKAYLACELSGCHQGLGSEGSINSMLGIGVVDEEFIAFVDIEKSIEVVASARVALALNLIEAENLEDLKDQLSSLITPENKNQKWLLKKSEQWLKGLSYEQLIDHTEQWPVIIEPDFRAMNCPERQQVIALAAENLVMRLKTVCPKCLSVNFVPKPPQDGVQLMPCELCSMPTSKTFPFIAWCEGCGFSEANKHQDEVASAFYCSFCNP